MAEDKKKKKDEKNYTEVSFTKEGEVKKPTQQNQNEQQTQATQATQQDEKEPVTQPIIHRYRETGEIAAVTLPGGKVFSGLDPETLKRIAEANTPLPTPIGAIEKSKLREQQQQVQEQQEQKQQLQQRQEELLPVAEKAGVFEERPEEKELTVTEEKRETLEKRETQQELIEEYRTVWGSTKKEAMKVFGMKEEAELEALIQNPETARAKMLQEIQREELNKARTASQKLGAKLEPWVGDLEVFSVDIGGYVDKFTRMPKQEAEEIVQKIKEIEGTVSGMADSSSQGEIGNPAEVMRDIAEKEEQIYRLEARLQKLVLVSYELRRNPEQVNLIETEVLKAKETLFEAKQRAAQVALLTPTDNQLYLKLEELRNENT